MLFEVIFSRIWEILTLLVLFIVLMNMFCGCRINKVVYYLLILGMSFLMIHVAFSIIDYSYYHHVFLNAEAVSLTVCVIFIIVACSLSLSRKVVVR